MARDPQTQLDIFGPVFADNHATLSALIVNENDQPIQWLSSITVTLTDKETGTIINGRNRQDVLNTNGGAFTTPGVFTFTLTPQDMLQFNQARLEEDHVLKFEYSYNNNTRFGQYAALLRVRSLQ
jgi:hypothetical protein